jgi:hypothetical protein
MGGGKLSRFIKIVNSPESTFSNWTIHKNSKLYNKLNKTSKNRNTKNKEKTLSQNVLD